MYKPVLKKAIMFKEASKVNAAGILFIDPEDNTVFLQLRSKEVDAPNTWSTPGGSIDKKDKDEWETALREVKEEAGSLPEIDKIVGKKIYEDDKVKYTTYFVTVKNKENWDPKLNWESQDAQWFNMDRLPENLHPNFKKLLNI